MGYRLVLATVVTLLLAASPAGAADLFFTRGGQNAPQGIQKLDEAKVLDEVAMRDDANVRVVQSARVSAVPRDLRPLVLALGFLVASVTTLLVAFLSDLGEQQ